MHFFSIRITGNNLDFNSISEKLEIRNAVCHKKGISVLQNDEEIVFDEDIWESKIEIKDDESLQNEIDKYVEQLGKHSEYIKELSLTNEISLWLTVYPDNYQLNFRLSKKTIGMLSQMGLNLDISIMNLHDLYRISPRT